MSNPPRAERRIAERTGGTTNEGKTLILGMGWFAVVADSRGSDIGLFEAGPRG